MEVAHNQNSMHIAGHTEHAHHSHLAYTFIHRLCGDILTQRVEVGCVGVVQFLWRTCVIISDCAQPPLESNEEEREIELIYIQFRLNYRL